MSKVQTVVSCFEAGGGISLNGCDGGRAAPAMEADLTEAAAEPADEAD